jgi:hypothetical protein
MRKDQEENKKFSPRTLQRRGRLNENIMVNETLSKFLI